MKIHARDKSGIAEGRTVCGRPIAGGTHRLGHVLHRIRVAESAETVTCAWCLKWMPRPS